MRERERERESSISVWGILVGGWLYVAWPSGPPGREQ